MLAVGVADQDRVDALRHLVGRDVVGRPPRELVDARVEQDDGVAVGQLVVRHAEESENDDVGIARQRTSGSRGHQRLTRGLLVERRIAGLRERGGGQCQRGERGGGNTHERAPFGALL